MTVEDLIYELENLPKQAEIHIAYQPNYPMCTVADEMIAVSEDRKRVYIAQTSYGGNDYLPGEIRKQLEW